MSSDLVLSLFPGIGLLDRGFEDEGFCVVRGPDPLWGGDIRNFSPPSGAFAGVIGGPPCQRFSPLASINRVRWGEESLADNLIPEFERCVREAAPDWFLMENVRRAPLPEIAGFAVQDLLLNNRWYGGEQNRERRFCFGHTKGVRIAPQPDALLPMAWEPAVTGSAGGRRAKPIAGEDGKPLGNQSKARPGLRLRSPADAARLQGLPDGYDLPGFTSSAKRQAIANGVPYPLARAIAKAIRTRLAERAA